MKRTLWIVCAFSAMTLTAACSDDNTSTEKSATYWADIAPIYYQNCVSCHQAGGIAPFALDNYQDASKWAASAKAATQSRTMPPWLVTDDGSCGSFHDSRALDDKDIATIARWVDAGSPEGTPRSDLVVPDLPGLEDAVAYTTPNFVPEIVGGEFARFDEYRCFLIDPALTSGAFLTGYEVIPGNAALVHHVIVAPVDPNHVLDPETGMTNLDRMRALDDESPTREGWPCFSGAGDGVDVQGIPVTWAPGMGVVNYPEGTGVFVAPGSLLVAQIHYNMADPEVRGQSDSTTVMLRYQDSVARPGFYVLPDGFLDTLFTGQPATLEPGRESVLFTWEQNFDEGLAALGLPYVDIYGVLPHMHERGHKFRFEVVHNDQSKTCGASVERWDFGWQLSYFYDQPIRFNPGDKIRVTCDYDTRGMTEPVLPGWGTYNEMCLVGLYLVVPGLGN